MQPQQERLATERADLDAKRKRLGRFIAGNIYPTLDRVERSRLNRQLEAMRLYSNILAERIASSGEDREVAEIDTEKDKLKDALLLALNEGNDLAIANILGKMADARVRELEAENMRLRLEIARLKVKPILDSEKQGEQVGLNF